MTRIRGTTINDEPATQQNIPATIFTSMPLMKMIAPRSSIMGIMDMMNKVK
jgi:hypothetical protein